MSLLMRSIAADACGFETTCRFLLDSAPGEGVRRRAREPRARLPEGVPVQVCPERSGPGGRSGHLLDVSWRGLRLATSDERRCGERVTITLNEPRSGSRTVTAVVRWWRTGHDGPGEAGLLVAPESVRAWREALEGPLFAGVTLPRTTVTTAAACGGSHAIAVTGPDSSACTAIAGRIASAGLPAQVLTPAALSQSPSRPCVVIAGPYPAARAARAALGSVVRRADAVSAPVVILIVPDADVKARRALVEAGALDCLTGRDGGDELPIRLVAAVRQARVLREGRLAVQCLLNTWSRDVLTGLPTRRQFLRLAEVERKRSASTEEPFGVVLLDIDYFKSLNDRHGHPAGDAALRKVARLLQANVRGSDLLGRFGGEEFVMLLPGASGEGVFQAAERIRTIAAASPLYPADDRALTMSIGVTVSEPPHETPFMDLLAEADGALYRAKHGGRNQVCW